MGIFLFASSIFFSGVKLLHKFNFGQMLGAHRSCTLKHDSDVNASSISNIISPFTSNKQMTPSCAITCKLFDVRRSMPRSAFKDNFKSHQSPMNDDSFFFFLHLIGSDLVEGIVRFIYSDCSLVWRMFSNLTFISYDVKAMARHTANTEHQTNGMC